MKVEQIYTDCLAEAAYYIESNGEAVIIDPLRDTEQYILKAKENKTQIKYVLETHFHADFVSGHLDLAKKTGAPIVYGPTANPNFDCIIAEEGQEFSVGKARIRVLHTPGHTPESTCYLLLDENDKEHAIFTGDTLFLGDVGRPDLAIKSDLTQEDLAGMLFDSLRNKIMPLPNDIMVYPAHGAGSACGKNMSSDTMDTLGNQKNTNYALRADMTKEEFIQEVTTGILPPPQYFAKNAALNKNGYNSVDDVLQKGTKALSLQEFQSGVKNGALILDVRTQHEFVKGFIPNSLFVGLNGSFAMWVGALIENLHQKIVLIAPEGKEKETVLRLARVGYDNSLGYLQGGINSWDGELQTIQSISAADLAASTTEKNIVDVRKPGEYEAEHVENATHYALDFMENDKNKLDKNLEYHIHCRSGYRSVIAASLLMQNGYSKLVNVLGGFQAIQETNIPTIKNACSDAC